ncbi:uncharacterized protein LOC134276981 isoform X2 [Saccostrea cucullata]|uniref:uncharacterized protein LOC134276981 isoform X2 n=1 Tax=Saccostrea cuccullata TaxID=36930 RepID=UPI002ED14DD5
MSINPTAALFILLCAFDDLPIVSNMDGCFGHAYACCVGFVWNQEERACVKCQNGYSGINCSEICQYPNYGEDCQNECKCTQEMCDHSKGCQDISTGTPMVAAMDTSGIETPVSNVQRGIQTKTAQKNVGTRATERSVNSNVNAIRQNVTISLVV